MSGSNWRLIVAAVGVLAFGFGVLVTSLNYAQQQHEQAVAAKQRAEGNEQRPQQSDTNHAGVYGPIQDLLSNPEPADGTEREKRDLAAQENTAALASWIVMLTFGQLVLSGLGLWALLRTLRQGKEAIAVARHSIKMEQRAWVTFDMEAERGPYLDDKDCWRFSIAGTARNLGSSPAVQFKYMPAICLEDPEGVLEFEFEVFKNNPREWSGAVIFPNEDHPLSYTINLDPARARVIEESEQGERRFETFLIVIAEYQTTFDPTLHYTAKIFRIIENHSWDARVDYGQSSHKKGTLSIKRYGEGPGFAT